jgi:predicted transposase YdaD
MTELSVIDDALEKGEAIGLEKGEHKKAVTVALKALEMGMSVEDAGKLSGLSKQQIEKLTSENL